MKVLMTCFKPFNHQQINYSYEVLKYIENVDKVVLDVVYNECYNQLKNNYILDEYEKLPYEWQKVSLNTLVYEKKGFVTFWIGARRYGYTTKNTKTAEPIREGHEFQPIFLDDLIEFLFKFKYKFICY